MHVSDYEKTIDFSIFEYSVPEKWYKGVYHDRMQCRKAARSFSLIHKRKADECWLVIHGYRGYPGEFVRPAIDLFQEGYDVFVPRLPGHGRKGIPKFLCSHPVMHVRSGERTHRMLLQRE